MNPRLQNVRFQFGGPLTPVVKALLWINGLVWLFLFIGQGHVFSSGRLEGLSVTAIAAEYLGLVPYAVIHDYAFWQPITYMFVHFTFWHLFWNMLGVWMFGGEIERVWGGKTFFRFYMFTGVGGAIAALVFEANGLSYTVGASGALFGIFVGLRHDVS